MEYGRIRDLIDIRGELQRNADGGPGQRVSLAAKRGVVVHYAGPRADLARPVLEVLQSEAAYHCGKVWGWGPAGGRCTGMGLMYHLSIGPEGGKFLCRDIEAVLWHCGTWPKNAAALAVHVLIGGEQHVTVVQRRALYEVCEAWIAAGLGHGRR